MPAWHGGRLPTDDGHVCGRAWAHTARRRLTSSVGRGLGTLWAPAASLSKRDAKRGDDSLPRKRAVSEPLRCPFCHPTEAVTERPGEVRGQASSTNMAPVDVHAASLRDDPLYLDRCQVDTPDHLVRLAWGEVRARREMVGRVVDFGAGDARFARDGAFTSYTGYEVDATRFAGVKLPERVQLIDRCAFSHEARDADLCIGNPPYVRNQDLPSGWRQMAAEQVRRRTGVCLSGLANAWQYFLMLALSSVREDGLVVQLLPYEWVSRPAAAPIRQWIKDNGWAVDVYRLPDGVFTGVLTAASITVVDKRSQGSWHFHEMDLEGHARELPTAATGSQGVVPYSATPRIGPRVRRGLSPGTQKVLTLTEGERAHAGLRPDLDVVRCVTSLRHLPTVVERLSLETFQAHYRDAGRKCWLVRTDVEPSTRLRTYLDAVKSEDYQTATCSGREDWWRFAMPADRPQILIAQAFKGNGPKIVENAMRVVPVGGVAGVYNLPKERVGRVRILMGAAEVRERLIPYAKQMHKLEINQLNTLLASVLGGLEDAAP